MLHKKYLILFVVSVEDEDESQSLREEAALQTGDIAADTSVSFARWQQGKQAGWVGVFFFFYNPVLIPTLCFTLKYLHFSFCYSLVQLISQ